MRSAIWFAIVLSLGVCACSQPQPASIEPTPDASGTAWPTDWSASVGQQVTLEGTAGNAKLGALLLGSENSIWIDGLDAWPEGFYTGGDSGKRLRVSGIVIKKDDVPAFVRNEGEPSRGGVPVASEEERRRAKRRYLLAEARWTVLD